MTFSGQPSPAELSAATILPDTDVGELVVRFQIWQALTHGFLIDNPMSSATLDAIIDQLNPRPGMQAIDIPCGRGELLLRLADRGVAGTGVDISPWVIRDALTRAEERGHTLDLHLGDGKRFPRVQRWDLACSLGGSWIWNGTTGTLNALASLTKPGGSAALGDIVLKPEASPTDYEVAGTGRPLTRAALAEQAEQAGFVVRAWFVDNEDAWEQYVHGCLRNAEAFETDADLRSTYTAFAQRGIEEFEVERDAFEWVVLVAERR